MTASPLSQELWDFIEDSLRRELDQQAVRLLADQEFREEAYRLLDQKLKIEGYSDRRRQDTLILVFWRITQGEQPNAELLSKCMHRSYKKSLWIKPRRDRERESFDGERDTEEVPSGQERLEARDTLRQVYAEAKKVLGPKVPWKVAARVWRDLESIGDAAHRLGVTTSSLQSTLYRARERFRENQRLLNLVAVGCR